MKRRNFLQVAIATLLAPMAAVKAVESKLDESTHYVLTKIDPVKVKCEIELFDYQKEALAEIQKWGVDELDEQTRKEILLNRDSFYTIPFGKIPNRVIWGEKVEVPLYPLDQEQPERKFVPHVIPNCGRIPNEKA